MSLGLAPPPPSQPGAGAAAVASPAPEPALAAGASPFEPGAAQSQFADGSAGGAGLGGMLTAQQLASFSAFQEEQAI
jgi:hypothetical protein